MHDTEPTDWHARFYGPDGPVERNRRHAAETIEAEGMPPWTQCVDCVDSGYPRSGRSGFCWCAKGRRMASERAEDVARLAPPAKTTAPVKTWGNR
ncbi:hypothetical protein [Nocardioides sp.]|uniref:hypothetical protein n=1 Tax=Nocardioides sp. TaxID=35761 RepID=UPI002BB04843|nr:hypothetical protein [Nocardioides sp.]HXH79553.1 hypothetical protein [Nocardioides sp.]